MITFLTLSIRSSTFARESLLPITNSIKPDETIAACVSLKMTKNTSDVSKHLSAKKQRKIIKRITLNLRVFNET